MPIEIVALLTTATVFLVVVSARAYIASRDPLHPALILAPLFFIGMVCEPIVCLANERITTLFPNYHGLAFAMFVQYLGMSALFAGVVSVQGSRFHRQDGMIVLDRSLTPSDRQQLKSLAWIIASFALFGFWLGIFNSGGFAKVYSTAKGIGDSLSGYFGEAQNLGLAALIIFALSCQLTRLRPVDVLSSFVMISPLLIQGTFGGRRGPIFLALSGLCVAYWIAKGRLPRVRTMALALVIIVTCQLFVASQRSHLYIGSGGKIEWSKFLEMLQGDDVGSGSNFVVSSGAVIATNELQDFHYGRRFLINFVVRPIPKQLFRNKYDYASQLLYGTYFYQVQTRSSQWASVLGWRPLTGFATNAIADLWMEFWWGYLPAAWVLGWGIGITWRNFRTRGGYWFVVYVSVVSLSIYLPTQSISAFAHRLLYLSLMTLVFWKLFVRQKWMALSNATPIRRIQRQPSSA